MNNTKPTLSPQLVQMISADVFWNYVYQHSFQKADDFANRGKFPTKMLSKKIIKKSLLNYAKEVPNKIVRAYYEAVKQEIISHAKAENNLIGVLYEEDILSGRTPDFNETKRLKLLQQDSDQSAPYQLDISANILPELGELIIRTPLPAMVISPTKPSDNPIIVASTKKALGFHKTMVLMIKSVQECDLGYVLEGVFQIPTKKGMNNHWLKLIPNATAFLQKVTLHSSNLANVEISVVYS